MAVQRENFEASQLPGSSVTAVVERMVRQACGDWTFHLRLAGESRLPDGRIITVSGRTAVRATDQIGRKRSVPAA